MIGSMPIPVSACPTCGWQWASHAGKLHGYSPHKQSLFRRTGHPMGAIPFGRARAHFGLEPLGSTLPSRRLLPALCLYHGGGHGDLRIWCPLLLFCLGALVCRRAMGTHIHRRHLVWELFAVYMYMNSSWSHADSAFAVGLFLWYWHRTMEHRSLIQWAVLGTISGLMIDIYYPNALLLIVPGLEAMRCLYAVVSKP